MPTLYAIKEKVAVVPSPKWGRFPHAFSHILPAATRRVITAIYGRMCWQPMRSLASLKKAFLIAKLASPSLIIF